MTPDITLDSIDRLRATLAPRLRRTPSVPLDALSEPGGAEVWAKCELWQVTGSFKARGALANCLALNERERAAGVTAVSAGNHAIATAWAARELGISARVVMTASAPPIRVERVRALGAEVVLADDVHSAFTTAESIVRDEGRALIHPFEGLTTATATAGVGRELIDAAPALDAVIVPVGGGGLAAGVATAVKLAAPDCNVFGVEPFGADSMSRSFAAGAPVTLERVDTIADSLGAPMALPLSYALCRRYIDEVVRVHDDALVAAMIRIHEQLGLAVEPACAAALAALLGPLANTLKGKRVGLIFCGSNMDHTRWSELVSP
ncbi:MAG: pyridoxal-phosphate dependent enzyme [Pseudomonadota bacterium]